MVEILNENDNLPMFAGDKLVQSLNVSEVGCFQTRMHTKLHLHGIKKKIKD